MSQLDSETNESNKVESLTEKAFSGMFWLSSSAFAQSFVRIGITIVLARLLTPYDFGVVGAALVVIQFAELFSLIGIGPTIVQIPNLTKAHIRTGFTFSLLLGGVFSVVTYLTAPIVAKFYEMPELTMVLSILALNFMLRSISVVSESFLRRDLQFRKLALADGISYALGYGGVGIILAWYGVGVWALVAAILGQSALKALLLFVWQPHPLSLGIDRTVASQMLRLGTGFTNAQIFNYLALKGDYFIVGRWLGAEALGYYTRAYALLGTSVTLIGSSLNTILFTTVSRVQGDSVRISSAYQRSISLVALLVIPYSAILWVLAPEIIQVLLGEQWLEVIVPFQVLAIGMYFRTGYKVSNSVLNATGFVRQNARRQGLYALMVVIGAFIGQRWGIVGVAWAVLGALVVHYFLLAMVAIQVAKLDKVKFLKLHLPGVELGLLCLITALIASTITRKWVESSVVILIITVSGVFVVLLITLRIFPKLLGQEGEWLVRTINSSLKKRVSKWSP